MKQADVKVGGEYLVKIGGREERVVVLREETRTSYGAFGRETDRTVFRVRTVSGKVLPKARTAAALRPLPDPECNRAVRFYRRAQLFVRDMPGHLNIAIARQNLAGARAAFNDKEYGLTQSLAMEAVAFLVGKEHEAYRAMVAEKGA